MRTTRLLLLGASVAAAISFVGCSRAHQDASPLIAASTPSETDLAKLFDQSSLVEIRTVSDLPDGLRQDISDMMATSGEGPNGRAYEFMIAGTSDTSALVAYEAFGYVPSTYATAYVHSGSNWKAVRKWSDVGTPKTLRDLQDSVTRFATPSTSSAGH